MPSLLQQILLKLPAEFAHTIAMTALQWSAKICYKPLPNNPTTIMGIDFANRVGIAAGLDKNADYLVGLNKLGVGFIEVGTITPKPQQGNPKPRLFRVPSRRAIINRMGFNNKGVDYLVQQVKNYQGQAKLGINIGKNKQTPNDQATADYLYCLQRVYPYADYITVNISSPNTPGLRALQSADALSPLLAALKTEQATQHASSGRYVPLVVKIAPDLTPEAIVQMSAVLSEQGIDGVIATNTTNTPEGGLSGQPLHAQSVNIIKQLHASLPDSIPIIGVGGISNAKSAKATIDAGASLVQVYTGLVYEGVGMLEAIGEV